MSGGDEGVDREAIEQGGPPGLGGPLRPASETSFEVELDEQPPPHAPIYVDVVSREHERRPIIPAHLRGAANIKTTAKRTGGLAAHRAGYHAARLPFLYIPLSAWYSLVGAGKLAGAVLRWGFDWETFRLQQTTARKDNVEEFLKLATLRGKYVGKRMVLVTLGTITVAVGVTLLAVLAPWWARALVLVVVVPVLAHVGRPIDKPIVGTAVVAHRHRKLRSDIVLRAYYAAGLGRPDKPDQQIDFLSTMARDRYNKGSQVMVALPHGRTFSEAMERREKIASGLDVALSQVYLTRDKKSNRSHLLWVADDDPLSIPAGSTPLLDCKPRDVWQKCPLGLDERGQRVAFCLVFLSLLIGAQPRKGKTFTARAAALFCALDPYVRLSVFDGKGSPDWRKFAMVAYSYAFGLLPTKQGDPIDILRMTLREIKKDILARNEKLSALPTNICPEGKLTREIARDPRFGMPIWVLILDEFQEFFNTGDDEADLEIADNLVFIVKVGPSVGINLISSTQKPSGIGSTGKVAKRFTDYRDQHLARFALKTGNYNVSNAILGDSAYPDGYDASTLPSGDEYRGVGILRDAPVDDCTVRTYLADGEDAEKILTVARQHREAAGTLDGMAAGEDFSQQFRDVLRDVRDVFYAGEAWISWQQIAARMAERMPEFYADLTQEAISAQVRALGVPSVNGKRDGVVLKGAKVDAVEQVIERRAIDG